MALARKHSRTGKFSGTLSNSDGGHKPAGPGGGIVQPQCGWKSLDSRDPGGIGAALYPAGLEAGRRGDFRIRRRRSETGHEAHHPSIEDAQAWHIERGRQLTSPDLPDQNCRPFGKPAAPSAWFLPTKL